MSGPEIPGAFPLSLPVGSQSLQPGMTLRDWYAGKIAPALASMSVHPSIVAAGFLDDHTKIAANAYALADALMAARKDPTP